MIKCPYCRAERQHITLDCKIMITCHIDEYGFPIVNDYWYNTDELNYQVAACGDDEMKFFCTKCGANFPASFDEEGHSIVPIEEIEVKDFKQ